MKRGVAAPNSLLEVPEEGSEQLGPINITRYYSAGKRRLSKDVNGLVISGSVDMTAETYASTKEANSSTSFTDQHMNFQWLTSSNTAPVTPNSHRHLDSSSNHVFKLLKSRGSNEDQKLQADLLSEKLSQIVELSPEEILE